MRVETALKNGNVDFESSNVSNPIIARSESLHVTDTKHDIEATSNFCCLALVSQVDLMISPCSAHSATMFE